MYIYIYIYIYIYVYAHIYIYIYVYIERERIQRSAVMLTDLYQKPMTSTYHARVQVGVKPFKTSHMWGWSSRRFVGFHDVPRRTSKIRDHILETELKVGSQMWIQNLLVRRGTRPKEALPDFGVQEMAQRTAPPPFLFGLFRGAPSKSETTFWNQLLILFRKWGLRFFRRASEPLETSR